MKKNEVPELGDLVKEKITGIKGIVTGITRYLTGCDRLVVQPQGATTDGKMKDALHVDITQVEVLTKRFMVLENNLDDKKVFKKTGGPQIPPRKKE